jgi:hypothetical protein
MLPYPLLIWSVGKTAALSLKLSLDKNFYQLGQERDERNIANSAAFSRVIESLPPDGQLIFLLGGGSTLYSASNSENISPLVFQVTASYSSGSEWITEKSTVDLRPYINTDIPHDPIVEEIGKLRAEFVKLTKVVEQKL